MKFIAHRGACCEAQEDTLAALNLAAELGADAVECDPRRTKDGIWVLFHDPDLLRLAKDPRKVWDLTLDEMRESLGKAGLTVTTLEELAEGYRGKCPVLLDLDDCEKDAAYFRILAALPFPIIAGVHTPQEAETAVAVLGSERVLAFMARPEDYPIYGKIGCGILRLWESWLDGTAPAMVKKDFPAAQVWIMSLDEANPHPLHCMDSSMASLQRDESLGADGVLLNNIRLKQAFEQK